MKVELTWLGQAGFLLETETTRLLLDPWVSPHEGRLIDPPPVELVADRIDWVLVTHEHSDHGGRFVGYVLRGAGPVVYHAGDTIATDGLVEALVDKRIEVALLPINGRDFFREEQDLVGNLDFREAVALARRIGARTLVPYHWDGYAGNTEHPGRAVDEAAAAGALHVLVLARLLPHRLA